MQFKKWVASLFSTLERTSPSLFIVPKIPIKFYARTSPISSFKKIWPACKQFWKLSKRNIVEFCCDEETRVGIENDDGAWIWAWAWFLCLARQDVGARRQELATIRDKWSDRIAAQKSQDSYLLTLLLNCYDWSCSYHPYQWILFCF